MLTRTEKALLKVALKYKKYDDDSNPEVGRGPTVEMLLTDVIKEAQAQCIGSIVPSTAQWAEILSDYK